MEGRAAYQFIRTEDLNCTLLMVRSGHALSPEGGHPASRRQGRCCAGANLSTKACAAST